MNAAWFSILLAMLATSVPAAEPVLRWQGSSEIAAGRGERGPRRQNDSRYDYVDDPAVAIDERGGVAVAWTDQGRKDVFFRRLPTGTTVNVSGSPQTFSWLPRIAVAPHQPGRLFILWQEIIFSGGSHGGDILFARSEDGGASFSEPRNLSSSAAGDGKGRISRDLWHNGSLDLAAGADGAVYAAWTEYEGTLWLAASPDGGKTFAQPRRVAGDDARPARAPAIALGPDRALYLAWTVGEDPSADIHIARTTDGGATFSEPRVIARTKGYSDAPKLAFDPKGLLHVVYAEHDRIVYARSPDGARSFEPPRPISPSGTGFPALRIDAKGNLYVLWERLSGARERPRGLGIALSRDAGRSFTRQESVPDSAGCGPNGSFQGLLMNKLAVNGAGAVAVVNSCLQEGERSRVWLMRGALSP